MMLDAFLTSLFILFLSEIADKTQLVIFALAVKFRNPWHVFAGALTAHAFIDGIAILLGTYTAIALPANAISLVVGISFIILGVRGFVKMYYTKKIQKKKAAEIEVPYSAMLTSFLVIAASEMGDKSQLASGILAASFKDPFFVFLGTIFALSLAIGINIFVGRKVSKVLPVKMIKIVTSLLFIAFGIASLLLR